MQDSGMGARQTRQIGRACGGGAPWNDRTDLLDRPSVVGRDARGGGETTSLKAGREVGNLAHQSRGPIIWSDQSALLPSKDCGGSTWSSGLRLRFRRHSTPKVSIRNAEKCLPAKRQSPGPSMWERGGPRMRVRPLGKARSGCNMCSSTGLGRPPLWSIWRRRARSEGALRLAATAVTQHSNESTERGQPSLGPMHGGTLKQIKNVYLLPQPSIS